MSTEQAPHAVGRPSMPEKAMHIDHLKSRIDRDEYAVDSEAVADAIIAMLLRRQNECS
jgi:anti-sigma28 factor (negative regulator of flagellin synthesis)